MKLEKRLLRQILSLCNVADHAKAKGVDSSFVQGIELCKCVVIAGLRTRQYIGIMRIGWIRRRKICRSSRRSRG